MQALDLLLNRSSQPRLEAPAPSGDALENIKQAALRAPDHAGLTPWQFIVCEGAGLERLGQVYQKAAIAAGKLEKDVARALELPKRAPMVMVCIAKYTPHEKVPRVEQIASASCGVYAMQLAALAQGFQTMWRTGSYAQDPNVKSALSLSDDDEIVGYLYMGSTPCNAMPKPKKESDDFFTHWS